MPCDSVRDPAYYKELEQREAERAAKRAAKEQEDAMAEIERSLGAGTAYLEKDGLGNWTLVGVPLPSGMHDSCVLAGLERRCSMEFENAKSMAGATNMDFVGAHDASHK